MIHLSIHHHEGLERGGFTVRERIVPPTTQTRGRKTMRQTVEQFRASLTKTKGCPSDLETQVNAWAWPQAAHSHLAVWRRAWQTDPCTVPTRALRLRVENSDAPGVLLRMAPGAPTPAETVSQLTD